MEILKVMSLNTRGLRNRLKHRKIMRYIKNNNVQICLLQECHSNSNDSFLWANEWGNKCIFSNGEMNACGVTIFFAKYGDGVRDISRDMQGRYLIIKLEIENVTYCICNIYAPNEDRPEFFGTVADEVRKMDCMYNVIGGDFNVVDNPDLDRSDNKIYNNRAWQEIKDWKESENLTDIWRLHNPENR